MGIPSASCRARTYDPLIKRRMAQQRSAAQNTRRGDNPPPALAQRLPRPMETDADMPPLTNAANMQGDPIRQAIINALPTLPEAILADILAMITAARKDG